MRTAGHPAGTRKRHIQLLECWDHHATMHQASIIELCCAAAYQAAFKQCALGLYGMSPKGAATHRLQLAKCGAHLVTGKRCVMHLHCVRWQPHLCFYCCVAKLVICAGNSMHSLQHIS